MSGSTKYHSAELNRQRRRTHPCWDHLIVAPLWVSYRANLGTLLRTCDAVGACIAVPASAYYREALTVGDTLKRRPHIHWIAGGREKWLLEQRIAGTSVIGVELADGARSLGDLPPARTRTIVCLGHEHHGLPDELWDLFDEIVEIPMIGSGASLNVAVAGSLVLYKLAGLL